MTGCEPEAVRRQLERILASEGFANADRISRFLRFTLETKLNGEQDQIKEYVIGREVFDRDDRYDPRIDPIVRVEARRLRARLTEYYEGPGRTDSIRIELPKGGYVPVIAPIESSDSGDAGGIPVRGSRFPWIVAAVVLLLAVAAAIAYNLRSNTNQEMIAVIPASWFGRGQDGLSEIEEGVAETVAAQLANREIARVVAWPLQYPHRTGGGQPSSLATQLGASKLLLVSARENHDAVDVTLIFADAVTNQKYWTFEYGLRDSNAARDASEAARIADAIEARLAAARE